jgi:RNA polymerase sigma-70 factor (sigma-E family)
MRQEPSAIETGGQVGHLTDADRDHEVSGLFRRHYTPMCRLAFVILGDRSLAEEVVMEALVKTFSGWGRIKDLDRSEAYLRQAVVNGCRSKIRRKVLERRVAPTLEQRAESASRSRSEDDPDTRREIWNAVRTLPERQRACVALYYYEDLPEGEIADVLGCSIGTVKSQLFKARAKLELLLAAGEETR